MVYKSLIEQNWSILLMNIDTAAKDTGKKWHQMMQAYDQESVSEQDFEVFKKMFNETLKKYNDMQDMSDLKIDRYSCYFWDLENNETSAKMTIVLGNEIDWKDATDDDRTNGLKVIKEFVKTFEQTNKNISLIRSETLDNKKIPHANIEFRLKDKDNERSFSKIFSRVSNKVIGNKKNRNQEKSDSEDPPELVEKNELHRIVLPHESESDKRKREKEEDEKERKRIENINKKEKERKEKKPRESKKKSNVETEDEPEQEDELEP